MRAMVFGMASVLYNHTEERSDDGNVGMQRNGNVRSGGSGRFLGGISFPLRFPSFIPARLDFHSFRNLPGDRFGWPTRVNVNNAGCGRVEDTKSKSQIAANLHIKSLCSGGAASPRLFLSYTVP